MIPGMWAYHRNLPPLLFAILLAVGAPPVRAEEKPGAVIGYLPHYRMEEVTAGQLVGITDLIYFGIEPTGDGRLPDDPIPAEALARLLEIRKANACRLFISIGGWNRSAGFPTLAKDREARRRFIDGLAAYCRKHQFSGIDYDWEHPANAVELDLYRELISDTRDRFRTDNLRVSVAQASWQDLGKSVYDLVDRVHLMSYDHEFPQATLEKSTADVQRLLGWGCPAGKIALGVPFYGRNEKRESLTYRELVAGEGFDSASDRRNGYAFNGPVTIRAKMDYVHKHGLAGIMIWELAQDAAGEDTSLLHAIRERVSKATAGAERNRKEE